MNRTEPGEIIRFAGVSKYYGALPVLNEIQLSIEQGQNVALIGASGCGKTTLLRCINALERIDQGELTVNGTALHQTGIDLNRFRARIGVVFQQYNLFPHLSVLDNIILGPLKVNGLARDAAIERAHSLLEMVGIGDKAKGYPDQLSGGQKQRVAIARALAMDPDILLLDEPTSALDPPMAREVLSVIEQVQSTMTLVMVTHEVRFVEHMADRLIFMEGGRIVEDGVPAQVLNQPQQAATADYFKAYR